MSTITADEFTQLVEDIKRKNYHCSPLSTKEARDLCRAWAKDNGMPCERGMIPWETYVKYVLSLPRGIANHYDDYFGAIRVLCPNCGNLHQHGDSPGHRGSHCVVSVIKPDQGYYVTYPDSEVA